jgi:DNA-directed RNA polymerase subunit RPC12/RpoP
MFINVTCPTCGHKFLVLERAIGQQEKCPACSILFKCGSVSPPPLATPPTPAQSPSAVQPTQQARAVSVQPDQSIHYRCARCTKSLESPAHMAGQKVNCPECGQRLQIPPASGTPQPVNRIILAAEEPPVRVVPPTPLPPQQPPPSPPVQQDVILTAIPASPPVPPRLYGERVAWSAGSMSLNARVF